MDGSSSLGSPFLDYLYYSLLLYKLYRTIPEVKGKGRGTDDPGRGHAGRGDFATAAGVENRSYKVTPASVTVKAGIIAGEGTEMKVTALVEQDYDPRRHPPQRTRTTR